MEALASGRGDINEGSSLEIIRHMVATGVGVSVLPVTFVNNVLCHSLTCPAKENQLVRFVTCGDPVPSRRVALVFCSSFPFPSMIDALADAIRTHPPVGGRLVSS